MQGMSRRRAVQSLPWLLTNLCKDASPIGTAGCQKRRALPYHGCRYARASSATPVPDSEERDRWERLAAVRDQEKWPRRVAMDVASGREKAQKVHEQTPAKIYTHEGYDSRGGTRTHDPGIMSSGDPEGEPCSPSDGAP